MDRPLLILDLDETLIHTAMAPLAIPHDFRCLDYYVHERPFLREFLASVSAAWDLAVWTSSSADYAGCIRNHIFADLPLSFMWTRERCTRRFDAESRQYYPVKDLRKVKNAGYDLRRVLMIDDTPQMLERNYGNLVVVQEFTGDSADRELLALAMYLAGLVSEGDLRAIEKRGWCEGR